VKTTLALTVVLAACFAGAIAFATWMPGRTWHGELQPLNAEDLQLGRNLETHVKAIAGAEHHAREYTQLENAAQYIEATLSGYGYTPKAEKFEGPVGMVRNIEIEIPGAMDAKRILVVGAHYDSVEGAPGANDNGSGTAAVLELARLFKQYKPGITVRFVLFTNEEPPYFKTSQMGSRVYAVRSADRKELIDGMLSLETIGYYSDKPDSQHYPPPFNLLYPDTGNFIGFVGNTSSRALVRRAVDSFRKNAAFPSEGVAAPGFIEGLDWSDHWSFWEEGYPGIMVTDTAPFRYPFYHTAQDTTDKIDFGRTARVVRGLAAVIRDLSDLKAEP
jgi:Zn-dependent M28 family amino/carboxypeptidase